MFTLATSLLAYNHNRKAFMTAHENENRDLLTTDQKSELDPPNRRHLDWEGGVWLGAFEHGYIGVYIEQGAVELGYIAAIPPTTHLLIRATPQKGQGLSTGSYSATRHIHLFPGVFLVTRKGKGPK